ncbi:MAG: acetamidase/formamidase family protein [Armatimonadota bacterium]
MRRLTSDHHIAEMSKDNPPAYTIEEGETVIVETLDCDGGLRGRDGLMLAEREYANPATGPIEVKGSLPGEALAVTIHEVKTADWGFISGGGDRERATTIDLREGHATYPWGLRLPLSPLVGVMGLAPCGDAVPTTTPGDHGGNLDIVDVCPGATLYLPVAVPGAMLALGDVHALQGDGEVGGTGIECAAEVTLSAKRVWAPLSTVPYLLRGDELMVLAAGDTLDDAAWRAVAEGAKVITRLTGLSDCEARRLLSTAGELRISQIVNPRKACRAVIPRHAIPDVWPF